MPKRIPVKKIILHRDGKMMSPELHKEFDFTAEELNDINTLNDTAIRKIVIEDKDLAAQADKAEKEKLARLDAQQAAATKAAAEAPKVAVVTKGTSAADL